MAVLQTYFNDISYQEFYKEIFNDINKKYKFNSNDKYPEILGNSFFMPSEFTKILSTRAMVSSKGKVQLGHCSKVFKDCVSTRFDHMCYSYILAVDLLMILEKNGYCIDSKTKIAFILKLLLHDNGHGPFSHPFEDMINHNGLHEEIGDRNILEDKKLYNILENIYPGLASNIVNFKEFDKYGLNDLAEGIFDLDRASYLIMDSHLSGINYEDGDLVNSIYNIFNNIILENGKVYYKKDCFSDIEKFLKRRVFNFEHIYHSVFRVLDDKLMNRLYDRLLAICSKNTQNNYLCTLMEKSKCFANFLESIKNHKANINLEEFYRFQDIDLETTALFSKLYDDEELTFLSRTFASPSPCEIMYPFDVEKCETEEEFDRESKENIKGINAKITITPYKEKSIIFINENGDKADFKDMEERTLDISPINHYYIFKRKKPLYYLNNEKVLKSIIEDYLFNNMNAIINNTHIREIHNTVVGLSYSISIKDFCDRNNISINTLMSLLSIDSNEEASYLFGVYSLSSKEKAVIFDEIEFRDETEKLTFISNICDILIQNGIEYKKVSEKLFITNDKYNIVFFSREILDSLGLDEKTYEQIVNYINSKRSVQKKLI